MRKPKFAISKTSSESKKLMKITKGFNLKSSRKPKQQPSSNSWQTKTRIENYKRLLKAKR